MLRIRMTTAEMWPCLWIKQVLVLSERVFKPTHLLAATTRKRQFRRAIPQFMSSSPADKPRPSFTSTMSCLVMQILLETTTGIRMPNCELDIVSAMPGVGRFCLQLCTTTLCLLLLELVAWARL